MEASFVGDRSISMSSCSPLELRYIEPSVAGDKQVEDKYEDFTIRMEASFVGHHSISMSSCSPQELRYIEPAVADDKQVEDKCEHFTIRGYVAEVRKKDRKIGWPFAALRNYTASEDAMLLPPLSVTKFKRWDCQTCLDTTISSAPAENGGVVNSPNYVLKNDNCLLLQNTPATSHHNAAKLFSGLAKPYEENALEGRSDNANSFIDVCNSEYHPSLYSGNKENASDIAAEQTKEGLQVYNDEHNISDGNLKQPNVSSYIAVEGEKFGIEEKGERNTIVTAKAHETSSDGEDAPISAKENEAKSIRGVANPKANVASFGSEADQLVSRMDKMEAAYDNLSVGSGIHAAAPIFHRDPIGLDDHHKEYEIDLVADKENAQNQKNDNQLEILSRKMKYKKIRKVRLLNDIMQNEEFLAPGKVHNVEEAEPNENADDKLEATSKWEAQNPEHLRHLSDRNITLKALAEEDIQNEDSQPIRNERMNKIDAIRNDYRQPILMQFLKKIPTKRTVTPNGDLETETNYCSTGISQPDGDTSAGKCLGDKTEVRKVRQRKRKTISGRKKNMLPQMKARQPHLLLQQDSNTGKGSAPKKLPNDLMQKKCVHSSESVIINEKILHNDLQIQDSKHGKNTSSNRKRKAHQVDKHLYQMHFPKGKVTKKRRTMWACDKGAADDIPMDIVELLANKLHDKNPRNVEYASKSTDDLSHIKKNLENHGVTGVSELHGNEGPQAEYEKLIQQKSQADTTRNGLNENVYGQPKAYRSSTNCGQGKNFYPIQQKIRDPSLRFHAFSHGNTIPMSTEELNVTGQHENSFPPKFYNDRSNLMDQMISDRNFGKAPDPSGVLLGQGTSGMNGQMINPNLNQVNMDSSNLSLKTDQSSYVHKTSWQRSSNPSFKQPLAQKWMDESSISQGIPTASTSVLEVNNGCPSKATRPADQNSSGYISALNFPAVWSGGYFHAPANTNPAGFIQESELSKHGRTDLLGSGDVIESNGPIEHQGNSCKLVRPVPRIGVLGSVLQKEIADRSGNFRRQSLFKVGCSNQIVSPSINAISRAELSKWIAPNVISTSHPECSRTNNVMGQIKFRNKDGSVQPPTSTSSIELCIVNRNPADFTLPDEGNVYMRGGEGLGPGCHPISESQNGHANREKPKQRRVKMLSALEQLMRG